MVSIVSVLEFCGLPGLPFALAFPVYDPECLDVVAVDTVFPHHVSIVLAVGEEIGSFDALGRRACGGLFAQNRIGH